MIKKIRRFIILVLVIGVIPYYYWVYPPDQKKLKDELLNFLKSEGYHISPKDLEQICSKISDMDFKESDGNTPLILACKKYNDDAVIKVFLDHGANADSANVMGETALMMSCKWGRNKNIDLLMRHGADVKRVDKSGKSALSNAAVYLHSTKGGYVPRSLVGTAFGKSQLEIMKKIIKYGANVNIVNEFDETPLIIAVKAGDTELVKLCIEHDAELNFVDKTGHTAFYYAEEMEISEIMDLVKGTNE